jgi:RNA polymerase sigma factor (TIGR02999 family)
VNCRASAHPVSAFDIPLLSITLHLISDVTHILNRVQQGDAKAAEELLPLIYDELRRLAAAKLSREASGQTLQATALVHEAWLRIANQHEQHFECRAHFFAAAAEAMRRILVDRARRRRSLKHGGGLTPVDINLVELPIESNPDRLLRVHEVLDQLAAEEPLRAEIVKLRFFVGMNHDEIARALNVSEKTVKRYWAYAKAWLQRALENDPG